VGFIFGTFLDVAAAFTSGVIVILIVLVFVGGVEAKKKRQEIFPQLGGSGKR
jgi:hypothetical protein